jgi:tRNA 5-methylaminomethyl-2-thiouridine biosynthesis bifunctional protein
VAPGARDNRVPVTAGVLRPADIVWHADGRPTIGASGAELSHGEGAQARAQQVFLAASDLPARWAGRDDFTVAHLGFGLGGNVIGTWQAWRDDPSRPRQLHQIVIEPHPPSADDLARAASGAPQDLLGRTLAAAWPPLVPGLHALSFEQGAVRLLLAWGDTRHLLSDMVFQADAFFLDVSPLNATDARQDSTPWDRYLVRALGRRARPGATLASAIATPALCGALTAAGFDWQRVLGAEGHTTVLRARHAPRWTHDAAAARPSPRRAVVVGAGLAGACTAAALAQRGFEVEVLDRHDEAAAGSSGNPAGLFHATVHGIDSPYARLFRAAALHTARLLQPMDPEAVPHGLQGLLRLELQQTQAQMQALLDAQGLPPTFVRAVDAAQASALAGIPLNHPAWFYAQAGWVSPAAFVGQRLALPGVRFRGACAVARLARAGDEWQCLDAQGHVLAAAPHVVLAQAEQVNPVLQNLGWPAFPLERTRGQVSLFRPLEAPSRLRVPVAGSGYVLPLPDGRVLCGATTRLDTAGSDPTVLEHRENLARVQRLCGLQASGSPADWQGRVGWRVQPADRLPVAGPVAAASFAVGTRLDQARLVPREPGLHVACGFGARGITLAPLLGDLVAARIAGTPWPLTQDLADAVDPARWIVRAARRSDGPLR